jgi:hypothetical protein
VENDVKVGLDICCFMPTLGGGLQSWNIKKLEGIDNSCKELRYMFQYSLFSLNYRKVVFVLG